MKNWRKCLLLDLHLFAFLGVLLFPFPFHLFDFQQHIAPFIFGNGILWMSNHLSGTPLKDLTFTSDTPELFYLAGLLAVLSLILAITVQLVKRLRQNQQLLVIFCRIVCSYYLALQLLKYGFDKLFKAQFYLPEPNILYTPVGQLDKDILFWTSMGTSWSYNLFMGLMEIIPAVFLLFKPTRVVGLMFAASVLLQVVMINYGFNISVKLFSSFLLFLCVLLVLPFLKSLYAFMVQQKSTALPPSVSLPLLQGSIFIRVALKTFVIGILFLEALFPYLKNGNFNDDLAPRPFLHGAYEVISMYGNHNDTLLQPFPVKRFFIHRSGYIIFQDAQDNLQDFKLTVDAGKSKLELTDYMFQITQLTYQIQSDSLLVLQYPYHSQQYRLLAKPLPWQQLPLLRTW